jgi:hypothetical protein
LIFRSIFQKLFSLLLFSSSHFHQRSCNGQNVDPRMIPSKWIRKQVDFVLNIFQPKQMVEIKTSCCLFTKIDWLPGEICMWLNKVLIRHQFFPPEINGIQSASSQSRYSKTSSKTNKSWKLKPDKLILTQEEGDLKIKITMKSQIC